MPPQSADWRSAARLLRRSGFGTTGLAVDALLSSGTREAYVKRAIDGSREDPGRAATPLPDLQISVGKPKDGATADTRARYQKRIVERREQLFSWWLQRMVAVEYPLVEKLTLVWHNHFATSLGKVRYPAEMAAQNEKIRSLCLGPEFGHFA
ncbi:DUF1800 family protein [Mycobacterium sp. ZZG]